MSTLAAPNVAEFPGKPDYVAPRMASEESPPDGGEQRRKEFGARVARRRAQLDLTQEQAAQKVGVTHRTYQRWEEGDVMPYLRNQEAVARAFAVPLEELLGAAVIETELGDRALLVELLERVEDLDQALNLLGSALFPLDGADADVARFFEQRRQNGSQGDDEEHEGPRAADG